jgi:hypothetical protein
MRFIITIAIAMMLIMSCSQFIRDDAVPGLVEYETQIFRAKKKADPQDQGLPFEELPFEENADIRLVIALGENWIKVYGYRDTGEHAKLTERRYLILYMFEEDFPDSRFDPEYLKKRLYSVVEVKEQSIRR